MARIVTVTVPRQVSVPTQAPVQTRVENGLVITESFPGHKGVKGQRGGSAKKGGGNQGAITQQQIDQYKKQREIDPSNWNRAVSASDKLHTITQQQIDQYKKQREIDPSNWNRAVSASDKKNRKPKIAVANPAVQAYRLKKGF